MLTIVSVLSIILIGCTAHSWEQQEVSPPYLIQTYAAFIGKHNDSIYIIGGASYNGGTALIEYNTTSKSFISHANDYKFGNQFCQSSTQIGSELYMLSWGVTNITKLNLNILQTQTITTIPGILMGGRCMTHFNFYLIVIGGYYANFYGNMNVYDIVHDKWFNGTSLPSPRNDHSCNVVNQTIYVFGGQDNSYLNDIWMLEIEDVNNCCYGKWTQLTATLSAPKCQHRSISVGTNVYIIGGLIADDPILIASSEVDVLCTETNEISSYSNMIHPVSRHSTIEFNSIIYIFGGYPVTYNAWYQFTYLYPTPSPTFLPTLSPSDDPTISPTQNPSNPTINPTFSPSASPTTPPSNNPSFSPTRYPTTITEYKLNFRVNYEIKGLSQNNANNLNEKKIRNDLIPLIETKYINTANIIYQNLQYKQFEIIMNDYHIKSNKLAIKSSICYTNNSVKQLITFISYPGDTDEFVNDTQEELRSYFDNKLLKFSVYIVPSTIMNSSSFNYLFPTLMAFLCFMAICSFSAFLFNKKSTALLIQFLDIILFYFKIYILKNQIDCV
eukprot:423897_1